MILTAGLPVAAKAQAFVEANNIPGEEYAAPVDPVPLQWLDGKAPIQTGGVTWGVPWPQGTVAKDAAFSIKGDAVPLQTWPLAYWPDGSLKWTAHAMAWQQGLPANPEVVATNQAKAASRTKANTQSVNTTVNVTATNTASAPALATENANTIQIDTGLIQCTINKQGTTLIAQLTRNKKVTAQNGKLVMSTRNNPDNDPAIATILQHYEGKIETAILEQNGPIRTTVKLTGKHAFATARVAGTAAMRTSDNKFDHKGTVSQPATDGRSWLPFTLRLYFYKGSEAIRIIHTIIFDGDEQKDFINGIGIRFEVPLQDELYNRHIRFAGENNGIFGEAVKGLTGLRRDPGKAITEAQIAGKAVPAPKDFPAAVLDRLQYIPAFGDYTLFQSSPDAFDIQKRTKAGYGWIQSAYGKRSSGTAYLGTPAGGIAIGIRNCWQSYPAQIDICHAHTATGELTAWVWAPKAPPMDLRFYHDGMGQDTYEKQREGLEITYEDYEPGFGTPVGVARTSELQLYVLPATPSHEELANIAQAIQQPPVLVCQPDRWIKAGVFATNWFGNNNASATTNTSAASKTSPSSKITTIDKQLDWYFDFYHRQVEQQHWYGFWNYGDVMHSYDRDRHVWKYDVGGFAWDNSELSTDLWLWYYFLRTGKADVFRMAEAMTRHTGEVDVHHLGKFSPLGSRHNVQHWGCSAKQLRISTVTNRRFYYYLTADERVGDLMHEQVDAVNTLRAIVPGRKIGQKAPNTDPNSAYASVSFGTDWGAIAAAWLTEWERTGNQQVKNRLFNSMRTIGEQPYGFFTGTANMELATGSFSIVKNGEPNASHLNAVFGLAEICAELIGITAIPAFEKAWLQYCELYNATPEEQRAALGKDLGKLNLQQGHARLTAFAATRKKDAALTARAWKEFFAGGAGIRNPIPPVHTWQGPDVLNPIEEAENVSTNAVAQWGLTALMLLGMIGDQLPSDGK